MHLPCEPEKLRPPQAPTKKAGPSKNLLYQSWLHGTGGGDRESGTHWSAGEVYMVKLLVEAFLGNNTRNCPLTSTHICVHVYMRVDTCIDLGGKDFNRYTWATISTQECFRGPRHVERPVSRECPGLGALPAGVLVQTWGSWGVLCFFGESQDRVFLHNSLGCPGTQLSAVFLNLSWDSQWSESLD